MNNGNMPAMPTKSPVAFYVPEEHEEQIKQDLADYNEMVAPYQGLTKREYFAAMAMQGLGTRDGYHTFEDMAGDAVQMADALLKALEANNE